MADRKPTIIMASFLLITLAVMGVILVAKSQPASTERDYGRLCLALAGWTEARSEGAEAMYEVGAVALRRSLDPHDRWPKAICDVVEERDQFQGVSEWRHPRYPWKIDKASWNTAQHQADLIIQRGGKSDRCDGALFFNQSGDERAPNFKCRIGSLYFYGDML